MRNEIYRNGVGLNRCSRPAYGIEGNGQLLRGHRDSQVSGILLIVLVEGEVRSGENRTGIEIFHIHVVSGLRRSLAKAGTDEGSDVVSTVTADDEGHGITLSP